MHNGQHQHERRTNRRHELSLTLDVFDSKQDQFMGQLMDITTEGIMLLVKEMTPLHQEYWLEIRLEDMNATLFYNDGESKRICFRAYSLWNLKTGGTDGSPAYKTGFRFIDATPAVIMSISYMIRKFRKKNAER